MTVAHFFKKIHFLSYVWVLPECKCTTFIPDACGSQKRVPDPQKVGYRGLLSCHVGAGNQSWVLEKDSVLTAQLSCQPPVAGFKIWSAHLNLGVAINASDSDIQEDYYELKVSLGCRVNTSRARAR